MDSEKSINSFKIKNIGYVNIYWTIFFTNFSITFWHNYNAK